MRYYKIIDRETVYNDGKKVVIDGMVYTNPSHEFMLENGWLEYTPPPTLEPTPEEKLEQAKANKLAEIEAYDTSEHVNVCYISYQGQIIPYWRNKLERDSLAGSVTDYMNRGNEDYRLDLREYGVSLTIPCSELLDMLEQLEEYAIKCYNKTTDHIFAVNALTSVEDVENYNYKANYPKKLTFRLYDE